MWFRSCFIWKIVTQRSLSLSSREPSSIFSAGALVWAKMEGHPWWPCMIVPQPLTGQQMRGRGRDQRLHVHFFDEPPTRGWVNTKYIREYQGEQVFISRRTSSLSTFLEHKLLLKCEEIFYSDLTYLFLQGSDSADAKSGGAFFSGKPVIRKAMELADVAMKDSPEQRLEMSMCMDPSGDEEEDDEDMEVSKEN